MVREHSLHLTPINTPGGYTSTRAVPLQTFLRIRVRRIWAREQGSAKSYLAEGCLHQDQS